MVYQEGASNTAALVQKTTGSVYGRISQVGHNNYGKIKQRSDWGNVSGTITQTGNGNTATLDQSNKAYCEDIFPPDCNCSVVF